MPSPVTRKESTTATDDFNDGTLTPPSQIANPYSQIAETRSPKAAGLSSPPSDTQPFSQFQYPPLNRSYAVEDEEGEGVWGYLVPLDYKSGSVLVLRRRMSCPLPSERVGKASGRDQVPTKKYKDDEERYEKERALRSDAVASGGYLIGRHPECGKLCWTH